jgi:hypothetical protein
MKGGGVVQHDIHPSARQAISARLADALSVSPAAMLKFQEE